MYAADIDLFGPIYYLAGLETAIGIMYVVICLTGFCIACFLYCHVPKSGNGDVNYYYTYSIVLGAILLALSQAIHSIWTLVMGWRSSSQCLSSHYSIMIPLLAIWLSLVVGLTRLYLRLVWQSFPSEWRVRVDILCCWVISIGINLLLIFTISTGEQAFFTSLMPGKLICLVTWWESSRWQIFAFGVALIGLLCLTISIMIFAYGSIFYLYWRANRKRDVNGSSVFGNAVTQKEDHLSPKETKLVIRSVTMVFLFVFMLPPYGLMIFWQSLSQRPVSATVDGLCTITVCLFFILLGIWTAFFSNHISSLIQDTVKRFYVYGFIVKDEKGKHQVENQEPSIRLEWAWSRFVRQYAGESELGRSSAKKESAVIVHIDHANAVEEKQPTPQDHFSFGTNTNEDPISPLNPSDR